MDSKQHTTNKQPISTKSSCKIESQTAQPNTEQNSITITLHKQDDKEIIT